MRKVIDIIVLFIFALFFVPGIMLSAVGALMYGLISPWGEGLIYKIEKFLYD